MAAGIADDGKRDESWRHNNIGRILHSALSRFESRVFDILIESGHEEARYTHLNLTRNLDATGTSTSELARRAGMSKQAMAEIVEQCETLGLVKRLPDKNDARAKVVKFTDLGLDWLEAFRQAVAQTEVEMQEELGVLRADAISSALFAYGKKYDLLGKRQRTRRNATGAGSAHSG